MQKVFIRFFLIIAYTFLIACGSSKQLLYKETNDQDSVYTLRLIADSLFNSKQKIEILEFSKKLLKNNFTIGIAYNQTVLEQTSKFAESNNAIAAINGSFFNIDEGGSATYLEKNDSVIANTRDAELKWGVEDSIINGAIILTKDNIIEIDFAKPKPFYEKSPNESFVLVTGPVLILNSIPQKLPEMVFSSKRHPRTCIGLTNDSIIFLTVDGRSKSADGMSLYELQKYMFDLGCVDAINLDGGGSTTMWIKNIGVVNTPSDKKGERPVANSLLLLNR